MFAGCGRVLRWRNRLRLRLRLRIFYRHAGAGVVAAMQGSDGIRIRCHLLPRKLAQKIAGLVGRVLFAKPIQYLGFYLYFSDALFKTLLKI